MDFVKIDADKCTRDLLCIKDCPAQILKINKETNLPFMIDKGHQFCMLCGHCMAICPTGALSLYDISAADCPPVQRDLLPDGASVFHLLQTRRSIRRFKENPVENEKIEQLIHVASYAPSGHNRQNVRWLVFKGKDNLNRLSRVVIDWMRHIRTQRPDLTEAMHLNQVIAAWEHGKDVIMRGAPNLVVAYSPRTVLNASTSCTIALTYLDLAAYASGIGSCWAGFFTGAASSYEPMQKELGLDKDFRVYGAMLLGYPQYHYYRIPQRNRPMIDFR